ncbi:disulfide bond formation protein B [Sphingopyxis sp. R3-92]|uniref:disulfide bond formation protein B n=1 Tax=Sphingopyxis sp. R3-92 TaxID=3158553 RepID=UPI003EE65D1B
MPELPPALARNIRPLGIVALVVSLATWTMEWSGAVEMCPYCEVQRTVIGLLGILMLVPARRSWTTLYLASLLGALGAVTAATQHFNGWSAIAKGEFKGFLPIYGNGFLLSGAALAIIVGQWMILRAIHTNDEESAPR